MSNHDVNALIAQLKQKYGSRITGEIQVPAREARTGAFPADLHQQLKSALATRGFQSLYSHQLQAWNAATRRENVCLMTPTASGKSLCYHLPVMQAALEERAKSLYLFPTKALSQDQVADIHEFNQAADLGIGAFTFDGDTPSDARRAVRVKGDIVVTNPDMLHQGILPHHTKWAQFFETLRYVVIDELHVYRGVFGSHLANVIRRLIRICEFYGTRPQFIACSATLANPTEHFGAITGQTCELIDQSGAPAGAKNILLWNPPVVNHDLGIRRSARAEAVSIAKHAIAKRFKTIVFASSRLLVEVITKYLKDRFDADPRKPEKIRAYRGGYLPTERRHSESAMRQGAIDGVVATSALELGVDIGALDVCVLCGYPGTIAATWQRWGRAGRRNRTALGVLVASSQALDQFMVSNPEFFLGASPEAARIAPDQMLILLDHVRCAAFELPFRQGETFGGQQVDQFLEYLESEGVVHSDGRQWNWIADSYPANAVNLRSVAEGNFLVVDQSAGGSKIIAEVDYSSAALTLYEGAIYMVQSEPWQVEKLDWVGRKAYVRSIDADYYTDAIDYTRLKILEQFESDASCRWEQALGEVHLVRRVTGYKKIRYYTHENIGYGNISLPDQEMHTTAIWWQLFSEHLDELFLNRVDAMEGVLGAANALRTVACLRIMCESRDLGQSVGDGSARWSLGRDQNGSAMVQSGDPKLSAASMDQFSPIIFLYDNYPGGIGQSAPLHEVAGLLVSDAQRMVSECGCARGCPACIGAILTSSDDAVENPKACAGKVLQLLHQNTLDYANVPATATA